MFTLTPPNPIDIVLAGLRTDAELLRRLLDVIPAGKRAARETVLREIESKIKRLESLLEQPPIDSDSS
jgi:hypothetical protein